MNEQNLKPVRTKSEARERGRKGGKKSGEARRKRSTARQVMETVLNMPITDETVLKDIKKTGIPLPEDPCYMDYIVSSIIIRTARRGQMADLQRLIEILGEESDPNAETFALVRELLEGVPSVID